MPLSRIPELKDVLNLVKRYHAHGIMLTIETTVEAGIGKQVTIQSFDRAALRAVHRLAPRRPYHRR